MARSDAILDRLLRLHPKIIDLSLSRMHRLLADLGNPERALAPVIHVAGTNGKGSVVALIRTMMAAAGLTVHAYTSPHLVHFNERIYLGAEAGGGLISEAELNALLEQCETVNAGRPITYFEITTAAALLAFSRHRADYQLLEVGLGGRLDATNVLDRTRLGVITSIDVDHQQFLGEAIEQIAVEKAGIFRENVPCIVAPQQDEVAERLQQRANATGTPLLIGNRDWQAYEQHGRLIFQDGGGLLDLPLPRLSGRHQIENAGVAIAAIKALADARIDETDIERGLSEVQWPGRLERLGPGVLKDAAPDGADVWIDGGHNAEAGRVLAAAMADLEERAPRPLILICAMLNSKTPADFLKPFAGLTQMVLTTTIPGEENAIAPDDLRDAALGVGLEARSVAGLDAALAACTTRADQARPRILICGSLYLMGEVLARNAG